MAQVSKRQELSPEVLRLQKMVTEPGRSFSRHQYYAIAVYPRLSFGPGQRYAAKGCFMAKLSSAEKPKLVQASKWVIHEPVIYSDSKYAKRRSGMSP